MPQHLARQFTQMNDTLDATNQAASRLASEFTMDAPRENVVRAHRFVRDTQQIMASARVMAGMQDYARSQWGRPTLDLAAKMTEVENAAAAVASFIETNFPTVQSTLNAAMASAGLTTGQQNSVRTAMGANLDYLLVQRFTAGVLTSPTLPAAQLTGLVTVLNALAAASTI